jgi:DNA-binding response OmpR family regulator
MFRILSVSTNTGLRITRDDILAYYGFTVVSPRIPAEAPLLMEQQNIRAVVIGHSVEAEKRKEIIVEIRRTDPTCPVIFVYIRPETADEPLVDESVDITDGLQPLVDALEQRLGKSPRDQ